MADTIDAFGDPLAFLTRGSGPSNAVTDRRVVTVEVRQMAGHQKEAIVAESSVGPSWRLTSDEGVHLHGTDLAPFPLGFFNAGLQADLHACIAAIAEQRGIAVNDVEIDLTNRYWLTGSFVHGTGEGHAEPTEVEVRVHSGASEDAVTALVQAAASASPAMAFLRTPLRNTFALYINGRRHVVDGLDNSPADDASDPFRTYSSPPRPLAGAAQPARPLVEKLDHQERGDAQPAANTIAGKQLRTIRGLGRREAELFDVETWLEMPGASHFTLRAAALQHSITAPSGLALLSAGISFCYMTQLARYIENMKLAIGGVRLVQHTPFDTQGSEGVAESIDTHLFLNGDAPAETHLQLLTVAARTCYLHATAIAPLDPVIRVVHNGRKLSAAA